MKWSGDVWTGLEWSRMDMIVFDSFFVALRLYQVLFYWIYHIKGKYSTVRRKLTTVLYIVEIKYLKNKNKKIKK